MKQSSPRKLLSLLIILLAIASVPLSAQTSAGDPVFGGPETNSPRPQPAYGTTSNTSYVLGGWEFQPYNSVTTAPLTNAGATGALRIAGTAGANYAAAVHLPTGAKVGSIEFEGCDNSAANQITATIFQCDPSGCTNKGSVGTGVASTGCSFYDGFPTPFTIDNFNFTYYVQVNLADTSNSILDVRLYYKLQVSPAPLTATFTDVPVGSLYFRFVEALVAAGITGGCGGGNYCPDAPVTRGQVAVFLSAALGLHWPN